MANVYATTTTTPAAIQVRWSGKACSKDGQGRHAANSLQAMPVAAMISTAPVSLTTTLLCSLVRQIYSPSQSKMSACRPPLAAAAAARTASRCARAAAAAAGLLAAWCCCAERRGAAGALQAQKHGRCRAGVGRRRAARLRLGCRRQRRREQLQWRQRQLVRHSPSDRPNRWLHGPASCGAHAHCSGGGSASHEQSFRCPRRRQSGCTIQCGCL